MAQFAHDLKFGGPVLLFSWPSRGSLTGYTVDETNAEWAQADFVQLLTHLLETVAARNIYLVAHSMGNRILGRAMTTIAADRLPGDLIVFREIVMIAPDIDVGIFKQYLPLIRPLARNMTVYVSSKDSPLALSRQVHGYPRLGEAGEHLDGLADIEIIDLSDVPIRAPSGHVYHLYQSLVTEDLNQLINENKTAAQRKNLKQVGENQWQLQQTETR